jgi:hypothetical protein
LGRYDLLLDVDFKTAGGALLARHALNPHAMQRELRDIAAHHLQNVQWYFTWN